MSSSRNGFLHETSKDRFKLLFSCSSTSMRAERAALTVSSRSPLLSLEDDGRSESHTASPEVDVVATDSVTKSEPQWVEEAPLEVEGSGESQSASPKVATESVTKDELELEEDSSRDFIADFCRLGSTGTRLGAGRFFGDANLFPTESDGRFDVSPFGKCLVQTLASCLTPLLPLAWIVRKPMHVHCRVSCLRVPMHDLPPPIL